MSGIYCSDPVLNFQGSQQQFFADQPSAEQRGSQRAVRAGMGGLTAAVEVGHHRTIGAKHLKLRVHPQAVVIRHKGWDQLHRIIEGGKAACFPADGI